MQNDVERSQNNHFNSFVYKQYCAFGKIVHFIVK